MNFLKSAKRKNTQAAANDYNKGDNAKQMSKVSFSSSLFRPSMMLNQQPILSNKNANKVEKVVLNNVNKIN